jgi:hypothetical protein
VPQSNDNNCVSDSAVTVCLFCCKRKNASGYWDQRHDSSAGNPKAGISHGLCPECLVEHYPLEFAAMCKEGKIELRKITMPDHRV